MNIKRKKLIAALTKFSFNGNGVVIGAPGVGKTFALKELCSKVLNKNIPCIYLPIDKLGVETESALKAELNIKKDFISYLEEEIAKTDKKVGILVIDAFDAARSENSQTLFLSLIKQVCKRMTGKWNVIVSVRTYDAKKSEDLLDLFPSFEKKPTEFQMKKIFCRHFAIPKLTSAEVEDTIKTIRGFSPIYKKGSDDFKELLRIPFNLWLVEKLLSRDSNIPNLSKISSEVQLLDLFWKQRVTDGLLGENKRILLTRLTYEMVNQHSLSVRKEKVFLSNSGDAWNLLLSSEILLESSITAQRIVFQHNILFDYAVSVLLIEDEPEKLVAFITEDFSRPLFLHPSLSYYFTRLWHNEPELFWKTFWHILPSSDISLRLFARLLPTSVILNEARQFEELLPLIGSLKQNESKAKEAILRLLQAHRALEIKHDYLWIAFLEELSKLLSHDFARFVAIISTDILDRVSNIELHKKIGRISRNLLTWVWKEKEKNTNNSIDSVGSQFIVPLVARTFGTNPTESHNLLEKIFAISIGDQFPIEYVYRLTCEIDKIWPYNSEFVALIYFNVFKHYEISEEQTSFGTPVLPLISTRKQDFHMCQYQLIQHFPYFLRAAPTFATKTAINCLNYYIISRHIVGYLKENIKLEDLVKKFHFRGQISNFISDNSYIWDENSFSDEPIQMANQMFKYIDELASNEGKHDELDYILDAFRDNVLVAFFWRRLLDTASKSPQIFANKLFELCIASPIYMGNETIRELGLFLEASSKIFSAEQLKTIEKIIINIPIVEKNIENIEFLETRRNRLLARIPKELLKTGESKRIRKEMEKTKKLPDNKPLVTFSSSSEPYTEENWLEDQGVDLTLAENRNLFKKFPPIEKFSTDWLNNIPNPENIRLILPIAQDLYKVLTKSPNAEKPTLNSAWSKLSSCVKSMSRGIDNPDSEEFKFCRKVLLDSAKHELPIFDPEFNYNSTGYSPAPRIEAAEGLIWLVIRQADETMLNAIENLAHDKVPTVRFHVSMSLWRLYKGSPKRFWQITNHFSEKEENRVVLDAFCHSLAHIVVRDESGVVEVLDKLVTRLDLINEESGLLDPIVSILTWLVVVRENDRAIKTTNVFLENPIILAKQLRQATSEALSYLKPMQLESLEKKEIADRAILWLLKSINAAANGISELLKILDEKPTEKEKVKLNEVYGVIDTIVMHLFFAADVREPLNQTENSHISDKQREKFYYHIKPILNNILDFASDEEKGLMFARTAHHFMELLNGILKYDPKDILHMATKVAKSGQRFQYNLDSLAVREVIKLVERILVDYKGEIHEGESLENLLTLLDIFADVGWPDAINFIWRLDEIFR